MKGKSKNAFANASRLAKKQSSNRNVLVAIEKKMAEIKQKHTGPFASNTHLSIFRHSL